MTINGLLDRLFRRHKKELLDFAERQAASHAAEDIVQEAFIRLMQHPDLSSIENHRAYLFKTTANLSNNQYQYDQVRVRYHSQEPVELDDLNSALPGPEAELEGQLRIERFLTVLGQLPEACQYAFILNKFDGLSYPDIAVSLNISGKTAQRYVLKAWQYLLANLDADFFDDDLTS